LTASAAIFVVSNYVQHNFCKVYTTFFSFMLVNSHNKLLQTVHGSLKHVI